MKKCNICFEIKEDNLCDKTKPYCKACLKEKDKQYYLHMVEKHGKGYYSSKHVPRIRDPNKPRNVNPDKKIGRPKKYLNEEDRPPKKQYYVPTGKPRGRPRLYPRLEEEQQVDQEADDE